MRGQARASHFSLASLKSQSWKSPAKTNKKRRGGFGGWEGRKLRFMILSYNFIPFFYSLFMNNSSQSSPQCPETQHIQLVSCCLQPPAKPTALLLPSTDDKMQHSSTKNRVKVAHCDITKGSRAHTHTKKMKERKQTHSHFGARWTQTWKSLLEPTKGGRDRFAFVVARTAPG